MRRWIVGGLLGIGALPLVGVAGLYWMVSHPSSPPLPIPPGHVAAGTAEGQELLAHAAKADLDGLLGALQTQQKGSWCGVASAVSVLGARGDALTQDAFFTPEVTAVRPWWRTTFGGMPIGDLEGMLEAHGADATVTFAGESSEAEFRAEVAANLSTSGDWLIVNYDRRVVGEEGGGHISPLGAYDATADMVLLLDVASYKYPPHWLPLSQLFRAMDTPDSESGTTRGWVAVR
jgi:hypothetical protein